MRLAIIGDVHGHWDATDNTYFDSAGYDRILVVGDLAGLRLQPAVRVVRMLAKLTTPVLLFPGNHDASHPLQLLAEVSGRSAWGNPLGGIQSHRLRILQGALQQHQIGGYSLHSLGNISLIAGRPHSMGGPSLSFQAHLQRTWGVGSLEESAQRLCALVDAAPTQRLLFLAHNGPTGLGGLPTDIWGCDFRRDGGDWGDPDLRVAIEHARSTGKEVLAVIGGHMHRRVRGGSRRTHQIIEQDILYLNAAEVPRIRTNGLHHHVCVSIDSTGIQAEDRWIGGGA